MQVRANQFVYFIAGILFFTFAGSAFAQKMEAQLSSELIDYANREVQTSLSANQIDEVSDDQLLQLVKDNLLSKMNKNLSNEYAVFSAFSSGRQTIYTIWQIEAEVNNGGFHQLFTSTAGRFIESAEAAFKAIQASKFAELVREVNEEHRKGSADTDWKTFDNKFISLYDQEDLQKLKIAYIRANKHEFADN
ncbi:DUF4375 domain-containing protein [Arcticibacter sp.]|uniref:DMP19 family protein n=1 Tax=Arcticibacter sp. TaxID=1872630 RepID=UPI00388DB559